MASKPWCAEKAIPIAVTSGAAPTELLVLEQDLERAQGLYQAFFAGKPEGTFPEFDE